MNTREIKLNAELIVAIVMACLSLVSLIFALLMLLGATELLGLFDLSAVENWFYSFSGNISMKFYTTIVSLISVVFSFVTLILANHSKMKGASAASIFSIIAVILLCFALAIDVTVFACSVITIK